MAYAPSWWLERRKLLIAGGSACAAATLFNLQEAWGNEVTNDDELRQLVHELDARAQIEQLRASYGWFVARGDYEGVVQMFAPDGLFEFLSPVGERVSVRGHEALRETLKPGLEPGIIFPVLHNGTVVVTGDEAHGTCVLEARTNLPHLPFFSGYYHDKARKIGGRWLFSERRFFRYMPELEESGLDMDGRPDPRVSGRG